MFLRTIVAFFGRILQFGCRTDVRQFLVFCLVPNDVWFCVLSSWSSTADVPRNECSPCSFSNNLACLSSHSWNNWTLLFWRFSRTAYSVHFPWLSTTWLFKSKVLWNCSFEIFWANGFRFTCMIVGEMYTALRFSDELDENYSPLKLMSV